MNMTDKKESNPVATDVTETLIARVKGLEEVALEEPRNLPLAEFCHDVADHLSALQQQRDEARQALIEATAKMAFIAGADTPDTIEAARLVLVRRADAAEAENKTLRAQLEKAQSVNRIIRAVLSEHGKHPASCPKGVGIGLYRPPAAAVCMCGIDAVLKPLPSEAALTASPSDPPARTPEPQ